jgi:hypothetical protein
MTLSAGQRIGVHEITGMLGAGGMDREYGRTEFTVVLNWPSLLHAR